jgi:hypothetical protein
VLKPHGTIGGRLIVTADQVLQRLDPGWEGQLRRDVTGRTVILVGYSGRDLDFHPTWDDVLAAAERVIWFGTGDTKRKRLILRGVDAAGRLDFPAPAPPVPANVPTNPGTSSTGANGTSW